MTAREARLVDEIPACRLAPLEALAVWAQPDRGIESLELWLVAEEFDVTEDAARIGCPAFPHQRLGRSGMPTG